jgi:hypothetical protein
MAEPPSKPSLIRDLGAHNAKSSSRRLALAKRPLQGTVPGSVGETAIPLRSPRLCLRIRPGTCSAAISRSRPSQTCSASAVHPGTLTQSCRLRFSFPTEPHTKSTTIPMATSPGSSFPRAAPTNTITRSTSARPQAPCTPIMTHPPRPSIASGSTSARSAYMARAAAPLRSK